MIGGVGSSSHGARRRRTGNGVAQGLQPGLYEAVRRHFHGMRRRAGLERRGVGVDYGGIHVVAVYGPVDRIRHGA